MSKPTAALPLSAPAAAIATLLAFGVATTAQAQTIRLGGSDSMVPLSRALATAYARQHPGLRVLVEGLGSERGLAALQAGELDIAAMSRPLSEAEREALTKKFGAPPLERIVALDGVGIYLHADNPVTAIRVEDLTRILSGEVRNWREVGGFDRRIDIYQPDPASGTRRFVQGRLLAGQDFASTAVDVLTPSHAVAAVARSLGGIAYASVSYAEGTKIVPLIPAAGSASVWPDQPSLAAGTYPLTRSLLLVCDASRTPALRRFVDWAIGPDGQLVVDAVGLKRAPRETASTRTGNGDRLRPDTEARHGIGLKLQLAADGNSATARAVTLQLRSLVADRPLPQALVLRLGDDFELPLAAVDGQVSFALRRDWLERAELLLLLPADGGSARVLIAAFADYLPPK